MEMNSIYNYWLQVLGSVGGLAVVICVCLVVIRLFLSMLKGRV